MSLRTIYHVRLTHDKNNKVCDFSFVGLECLDYASEGKGTVPYLPVNRLINIRLTYLIFFLPSFLVLKIGNGC